jgi:hypothetical protein
MCFVMFRCALIVFGLTSLRCKGVLVYMGCYFLEKAWLREDFDVLSINIEFEQ